MFKRINNYSFLRVYEKFEFFDENILSELEEDYVILQIVVIDENFVIVEFTD